MGCAAAVNTRSAPNEGTTRRHLAGAALRARSADRLLQGREEGRHGFYASQRTLVMLDRSAKVGRTLAAHTVPHDARQQML